MSADQGDLYSILSVPPSASQAEIKAAYRRLVHDHHPDKHAHKQGGQVGPATNSAGLLAADCDERHTPHKQQTED